MPAELKDRLDREASIRRRSLNSEIVTRLESSFERVRNTEGTTPAAQPRASYEDELSDTERAMLAVFRRLGPEKQLALLSLFK